MADVKRATATETGGTVSESTPGNTAACVTVSPVYFTIATTQSDIDFEREKSAREDIKEGISIRHFSDAYLETLAVYRKIADQKNADLLRPLCGTCGGADCTSGSSSVLGRIR